jgi:hypothetical protein
MLVAMTVIAMSHALRDTLGLVGIFFVLFPLIAQGLIAFAVAQGLGERAENEKLKGRWGRKAIEAQEAERRL